MTTTFESREQGFEKKFVYDKEKDFTIAAKANYLLGLWAAEKLDLDKEQAVDYAKSLVEEGVEDEDMERVKSRILKDLVEKEFEVESLDLDAKLQKFIELAQQEQ